MDGLSEEKKKIMEGKKFVKTIIYLAVALFAVILCIEFFGRYLTQWVPLENESPHEMWRLHRWYFFLEWSKPYLLAGLGASIFLLRQVRPYIRNCNFQAKYKQEYWLRFWIGVFAGGTAVLVFFEELSSTADGRISLSEAMVGFMFGYASDVFFKWLDVTLKLFKPNVEAAQKFEKNKK